MEGKDDFTVVKRSTSRRWKGFAVVKFKYSKLPKVFTEVTQRGKAVKM